MAHKKKVPDEAEARKDFKASITKIVNEAAKKAKEEKKSKPVAAVRCACGHADCQTRAENFVLREGDTWDKLMSALVTLDNGFGLTPAALSAALREEPSVWIVLMAVLGLRVSQDDPPDALIDALKTVVDFSKKGLKKMIRDPEVGEATKEIAREALERLHT